MTGDELSIDNPLLVRWEFASEERLATRNAIYNRLIEGDVLEEILFDAVAERRPGRALEVGCGAGELAERLARELDAEMHALDSSDRMVSLMRERGVDARVSLVRAVVEARPRRVLEVGCGWGELAEWIARETAAEVVATDLSSRMVELACERGVAASVADVQRLPFADGEFDVAVAAWMLYHVPALEQAIAELARVLRPGGRLVAVTNSVFHLHELRELVGSGPSTIRFSRESGEELLRASFARVERLDVDGELEFAMRAEVEDYVRASIAMSPFVANLPATIDEPFRARRANSIFVAEKAP